MGNLKFFKSIFCCFVLMIGIPAAAIVNGQPALEKRFEAVGSLYINNEKDVACTATLIAPNWIVTADHCVHVTTGDEGDGPELAPDKYEFRLGQDSRRPIHIVKLKRWVSGPVVQEKTLDIAFGELSSPVPIAKLAVQMIPLLSQEWNEADLHTSYLHIGYGAQQAFSIGKFPLTDKRQLAQFKVTNVSGNALLKLFGSQKMLQEYITQFHPEAFEAGNIDAILANAELLQDYIVHAWDERGRTNLNLKSNEVKIPKTGWQDTCFGDSGGPLLREVQGQLQIVGVVSQGMDRICSPLGTIFTVFGPEVRKLITQLGIR